MEKEIVREWKAGRKRVNGYKERERSPKVEKGDLRIKKKRTLDYDAI